MPDVKHVWVESSVPGSRVRIQVFAITARGQVSPDDGPQVTGRRAPADLR